MEAHLLADRAQVRVCDVGLGVYALVSLEGVGSREPAVAPRALELAGVDPEVPH